jgi:hypothetical protein
MTKEYTPIRQVYAWVGFVTLMVLAFKGIVWFVWAHQYIAAAGY